MRSYFFNPVQRRQFVMLAGDVALILASFFLSMALRVSLYEGGALAEITERFNYMYIVLTGVHLLFFYIFGLYDTTEGRGLGQTVLYASLSVLASLLVVAVVFYLARERNVGRVVFFLHFGILVFLIVGWRMLLNWVALKTKRKILIVGDGKVYDAVTNGFAEAIRREFSEIEHLNASETGLQNIARTINGHLNGYDPSRFSILFSSYHDLPQSFADQLVDLQLKGVEVNSLTQFARKYTGKLPVNHTDLPTFLNLSKTVPATTHRVKRILDIVFSSLVLLLLAPLFLLIAIAIKLDSPGPVLYVQKRMGRYGREYPCFKFRTMVADAEKHGPRWAEKGDSRVTRVGRILRSTRMDELPQFLNVLRGEMSIVGPRPIRKYFEDQYVEKIPYYKLRHLVKPGITGWAQVHQSDPRTVEGVKERLEYDLFYIVNMSVFLDLLIGLKTVRSLVNKVGRESAI
jgi:exopolysaccharide biosynthesis polyprenyl glycosylphosphotransferase